MVHADDVFVAIKTAWGGSVALQSSVPGGLWQGRPAEAVASPYAVATIEEGEPIWTSGTPYIAIFTVTLSVWSTSGALQSGDIRRSIDLVLKRDTELNIPHATRTIDCRPLPGKVELDQALKDQKDVLVTAARWEISVQASRPAAEVSSVIEQEGEEALLLEEG